jgi:hypothetical protein
MSSKRFGTAAALQRGASYDGMLQTNKSSSPFVKRLDLSSPKVGMEGDFLLGQGCHLTTSVDGAKGVYEGGIHSDS